MKRTQSLALLCLVLAAFPQTLVSGGAVESVGAYRSLNDAVAKIGATPCDLRIDRPTVLTAALTVPANIRLVILREGSVNIESHKLTISGPCECAGVISGTGTLAINGTFSAIAQQAFRGTGIVMFGRDSVGEVCPDWWGVNGNVPPYDTAAVQAALNAVYTDTKWSIPVGFHRDYFVTEVTSRQVLGRNNLNNHRLIGVASAPTGAVLNIMSTYTTWRDVWVDANYNTNYKAAVRIYSDNTSVAAFLKIYGIQIWNSITGLVYGAFPGEPTLDKPQSESFIHGLSLIGVERCIYANQPNGRLWVNNSQLTVQKNNWPKPFNYATSYLVHNEATGGGSLFFNDCDFVNSETLISESRDPAVGYGIKGKNIYTKGVAVWEVFGANVITGDVVLNQTEDGGDNALNGAYFQIARGATGTLKMRDVTFLQPVTQDPAASGEMLVDAIDAPDFTVEISDSHFENYSWVSDSSVGFRPLVRGCNVLMKNVLYSDTFASTRTRYSSDPKSNILTNVDTRGTTVPSKPDRTPKGGWTWGVGGGTGTNDTFGGSTDGPPPAGSFIRINSTPASTGAIQSPPGAAGFRVQPGAGYTVTLVAKQITDTAQIKAAVHFYRFDGSASTTASKTILNFAGRACPDWTKLLLRFDAPSDAAYASLWFGTNAGGSAGSIGISDIVVSP